MIAQYYADTDGTVRGIASQAQEQTIFITLKIKKKSRRIRAYDNNNHTPLYRLWNSGLDEQSTIDSA